MGMCPLTGHRVVEPVEEGGKDHNNRHGDSSSDDECAIREFRHGAIPANKYDSAWKREIPKGFIASDEYGNRLHPFNQALVTRARSSERD